jgi:hypothetical protein
MPENRNKKAELERGLTTDIAIATGPTLAVVANHLLNQDRKPKDDPPPPPKKD